MHMQVGKVDVASGLLRQQVVHRFWFAQQLAEFLLKKTRLDRKQVITQANAFRSRLACQQQQLIGARSRERRKSRVTARFCASEATVASFLPLADFLRLHTERKSRGGAGGSHLQIFADARQSWRISKVRQDRCHFPVWQM